MSINRVTLTGNLTREPELRATAGGTSVLQFGVAVNDRRKNAKTGEWEDVPNYIDCVMFGARAQAVANYVHAAHPGAVVRYVTCEAFLNAYLDSLHTHSTFKSHFEFRNHFNMFLFSNLISETDE